MDNPAMTSSEAHVVKSVLGGELQKQLSSLPSECRIQAPKSLVDEKPAAYIPKWVSIGPLYHGQAHLQSMEAHKMRYFQKFLNRKSTTPVDFYIEAVRYLEERAYQCYPDQQIDRNSFVKMMVVDGCFILELLLLLLEAADNEITADYKWIILVGLDLILVGNQIPMFVLKALYGVFISGRGGNNSSSSSSHRQEAEAADDHKLEDLMRRFFEPRILENFAFGYGWVRRRNIQELEPEHLLDFVRRLLFPPFPDALYERHHFNWKPENGDENKCVQFVSECAHCLCRSCLGNDDEKEYYVRMPFRCATELSENEGVKFRKNKQATSLVDIEFDPRDGVLRIPGIIISDEAELIFRNIFAYEKFASGSNDFMVYATFMDSLIDSRKDLELLQKNGIIEVTHDYPTKVARKLFSDLLKDVIIPLEGRIFHILREVERYTNRRRHRWDAKFRTKIRKWTASFIQKYFDTPWSFISLVAATILLATTVISTVYAVLTYYHQY